RSGARIVNFCGHDCVPWDLAVYRCAKLLESKGETMKSVEVFDEIVGGVSGGTIATIIHSLVDRSKVKASLGYDPLLKCYTSTTTTGNATSAAPSNALMSNRVPNFLHFNKNARDGKGSWMGPFV